MAREIQIEKSFDGDQRAAFDAALRTLLPLGFDVLEQDGAHLRLSGPGMRSTRQNPILGATQLDFEVASSRIVLRAELGGVARIFRLILFIVLGLSILELVVFGALIFFLEAFQGKVWVLLLPLVSLLPWVFLAPLIIHITARRTRAALDSLLDNMLLLS